MKIAMTTKLVEALLKHMNIRSVYYYNSNFVELGRVDHTFLPQWSAFVASKGSHHLVANNALLGDTIIGVVKQLFINFTLFDASAAATQEEDDFMTLVYKEDELIAVNTLLAHLVEDRSTFVQMDKLRDVGLKRASYPFPHAVIDDFLEKDRLTKILAEVNKLQDADAQSKYIDTESPYEFNKYVFSAKYGPYLGRLFTELHSPDFIKHIERITGVQNIICNDVSLHGTGVHRVKSKGFSQPHTDFNTYHSKNRRLDRRINLLIYLNPDWKTEYNGQLCLCDANTKMCAKKIEPILNRCVIFNTTRNSIHGHPLPLNVPDNVVRQSIAVYYYTENTQGDLDVDFEGAPPRGTTWYPDIDVSTKPKQIFYV